MSLSVVGCMVWLVKVLGGLCGRIGWVQGGMEGEMGCMGDEEVVMIRLEGVRGIGVE